MDLPVCVISVTSRQSLYKRLASRRGWQMGRVALQSVEDAAHVRTIPSKMPGQLLYSRLLPSPTTTSTTPYVVAVIDS